jgi:type I restriction enzyme R subunit
MLPISQVYRLILSVVLYCPDKSKAFTLPASTPMSSSSFSFLRSEFPTLFNYASQAESYAHPDPETSGNKLRIFLEKLIDHMFVDSGLSRPDRDNLYNRINLLDQDGLLPTQAFQIVDQIRRSGNRASHGSAHSTVAALHGLKRAFRLSKWFFETYSDSITPVHDLTFVDPVYEDPQALIAAYKSQYEEAVRELAEVKARKPQEATPPLPKPERRQRAERAANRIEWSEEETRELIDQQLRTAGWEADSPTLNYHTHKTLPERGRNMAIAEWPCGRRRADYALFIGLQLYAIVEAKRYGTDIYADLTQAKNYAYEVTVPSALNDLAAESGTPGGLGYRPSENILLADGAFPIQNPGAQSTSEERSYRAPFLFATNGRPYLRQLETKSGIWFLDARGFYNSSRVLTAWYSPQGLKDLYEQDLSEAEQKLSNLEYDYLQIGSGLDLRDYQVDAIREFEKALVNNPGRRRALITMATGTGKTRTAIGLAHRLIKTNRFRRILFLVDRRYLAEQAFDNFKENKVEGINTFAEIYEVKEITDQIPDVNTRLHFATVQSLVKRLFHQENDDDVLPVDTYDMIIVDEAHRGYNEDGELSEDELVFKDQNDYVSQYRRVLEYFDAFALGLTATPALHTSNIFGSAVFTYSYREAVLAGYLIDHETPINIETRLNQEGIIWSAGDRPTAYDPESNSIVELEALDDDLHIDVTGFNRLVITEPFNRVVAQYLAENLDPDSDEKTLIFAVRQSHAELIAKLLKEAFVESGLDLNDDAIMVITGKTDKVRKQIKRFRNERNPNIAITVDLLTTGVDIPRICNLVFVRRVGSRILYEQMVGRATRTCDEIGKEVFNIYDAVRLYESIQELTQMRPVVTRPNDTFEELAEELPNIPSDQGVRNQVSQLLAKMQRKQRGFSDQDLTDFRDRSEGRDPQQLADYLINTEDADLTEVVPRLAALWRWLDVQRAARSPILVSEHEDEFRGATPSFGIGRRPEDYLEAFSNYIRNNQNQIAAINIVCTKPRELDRASLKELLLQLEDQGFRARDLNAAHRATSNVDLAADMIAHIRSAALGSALIPHEQRVTTAMQKIRANGSWSRLQLNWLDKFEKQLIAEKILRPEDINRSPFKEDGGGFDRIDKAFKGNLANILESITAELYPETA